MNILNELHERVAVLKEQKSKTTKEIERVTLQDLIDYLTHKINCIKK